MSNRYHRGDASTVPAEYRNLRAADLADLPTLAQGQIENLKIDDGTTRVWLSRGGVADGLPCDSMVSIERLRDGKWRNAYDYEPIDAIPASDD